MRLSHSFIKTKKQAPKDEVAANAQLLTRAGFIHKEMAGVYAYLPLGKRVLDNIAQIVREEMNGIGAEELQMTVLQPKDIWEKSDRWDDEKVDNWFKTKLVNGTELGVGWTHEEPIVDALRDYVNSYKDLPISVYQIQTKFRNELRAKSGLLRGREFTMKDMYTLARSQAEHSEIYERVAEAYVRVYARLGIGDITYRTYADGGTFTDKFSDEFQTISPIGEDTIYVHEGRKVAVNQEIYTDENLAKLGLDRSELVEQRGVEVGNIFPLETKYTDALGVYYTDESGQQQSIIMGCYGIGISRLMGLLAEHFSDDKGLVWPVQIAPASVHLVSLRGGEAQADALYQRLIEQGIGVVYDDRELSAGAKLADADLMGMPWRVVASAKTVESAKLELTRRQDGSTELVDEATLTARLAERA
ncbi:MAG: aminoacyl--tRNA ligase-related protein [Candidatus Saccharimonadales bacterium]